MAGTVGALGRFDTYMRFRPLPVSIIALLCSSEPITPPHAKRSLLGSFMTIWESAIVKKPVQ